MFYDKFRKLCLSIGKTPTEVGREVGVTSAGVTGWHNGYTPKPQTMIKIANYFDIPIESLYNDDEVDINERGRKALNSYTINNLVSMPIVGSVKAGYDGLAREDYDGDYISVSNDALRGYAPNECRVLRVNGDSMYPLIVNGDTVLVHLQEDVDSGDIAVVMAVNGEATIKQIIKEPNVIKLVPKNPEYPTKTINNKNSNDYVIYGKVLRMMREF